MWYIIFYSLGITLASASSAVEITLALDTLEPITITALIASLLVPFGGFAANERWQKFAVQYGMVPLFGVYTVSIWQNASLVGLIILITASAVHAGYWLSAIHSRIYRLKQFEFGGFGKDHSILIRKMAAMNGTGNSHQTDLYIQEIFQAELAAQRLLSTLKQPPLEQSSHGK